MTLRWVGDRCWVSVGRLKRFLCDQDKRLSIIAADVRDKNCLWFSKWSTDVGRFCKTIRQLPSSSWQSQMATTFCKHIKIDK